MIMGNPPSTGHCAKDRRTSLLPSMKLSKELFVLGNTITMHPSWVLEIAIDLYMGHRENYALIIYG